MSVTFETKVWENDWELIMKTSRIRETISNCHYSFKNKILYINNVNDLAPVESAAQEMIQKGIIDKYINVNEYSDLALNYFNLSKEKLGRGYYYSIAELVSIYLSETKYILHLSGDTSITPDTPDNWLEAGVDVLEKNSNVKVFNLVWNYDYKDAKNESESEDNDFYYGYGFSDQMYLIRTADFKQKIYEYYDKASDRYPKYGGELFEKRVDSWMRQNKCLRATYKHGSYTHKNFATNKTLKNIAIFLDKPGLFRR
jgi:hypothetical protein